MPFDGAERDWGGPRRRPRFWYTISPAGQRNRRKRWQIDILIAGEWFPLFSFYADNKRHANAIAYWAVRAAGY